MKYFVLYISVLFGSINLVAQDQAPFIKVTSANLQTVTKTNLTKANTLLDINPRYPTTWIASYSHVVLTAILNGNEMTAISVNDTLTSEQKTLLNKVETGAEIKVEVKYTPENSLLFNEEKIIDFMFEVGPAIDAEFIGGDEKLDQYLRSNTADKLSKEVLETMQAWGVKFFIDAEGNVVDVAPAQKCKDERLDATLLEAICNMPKWKPAVSTKGEKIKQEFLFQISRFDGC